MLHGKDISTSLRYDLKNEVVNEIRKSSRSEMQGSLLQTKIKSVTEYVISGSIWKKELGVEDSILCNQDLKSRGATNSGLYSNLEDSATGIWIEGSEVGY